MSDADARAAFAVMADLVLDNQRRQAVSEAVGLPFARVRALKRIAAKPMTLGDLATAMNVDPPNCTTIVDDLENRGLVERRPHPTDRRSKLVVITRSGALLAKKAKAVMDRPPASLSALSAADLRKLAEILGRVDGSSE
jgi:DNA-binding MarR family transcriptional regulator